jgi:hypothetical protein
MNNPIRDLLIKGQSAQDAAKKAEDALKVGVLRGGTAGCVTADGKILGNCHRVALARVIGIDKSIEFERHIMFDAGNAAEDSWAAKLLAAGADIRRESEIPVTVDIGGRLITGRPDIVLGEMKDEEFVPTCGIELKGVFSASTAVKVLLEDTPDVKHLTQAAFYSMSLNIPYWLCYTNPSAIDTPYWAIKKLGAPKKIQPFYKMFELKWDGDTLHYRDENQYEFVETVITKQGIMDYYKLIDELAKTESLGPRFEGGTVVGGRPPYSPCEYCDFSEACDKQTNFVEWKEYLNEYFKET